ncbi:MAG TPA: HEPN/Toprim-associated domain-containing protein [Burkholderiales bacterium]|nr:HEPN/Toprim-associated domain-containing protein [Burkholderiales bacterium]
MIHLAVGQLEVDWGKNNFFTNHSALFQSSDLKLVPSYYAGDNWPDGDPIVEMNEGLGKPLGHVVDRLELLGHTLRATEHHYNRLHQLHDLEEQPIPFDQLREALRKVDVTRVSGNYREDYKPGQFVRTEILDRLALDSEKHDYYQSGLRPDHWEVDLLLENFGANGALRLLAENKVNHALDVSWDFTPLVESGWATRDEFRPGPLPEQRFLIVTEGSSDAKILQKALELFRPHISDFFRFVDMEEGYPFSGTGNLHRFAQGLISIGVQNNTVIVYDNDAEGIAKMAETKRLSLPPNMRVMQLPPHDDFIHFKTIGPTGVGIADINGKAAAIECYLDLQRVGLPEPIVRWSSFNRDLGIYHGELQHKTQYMKDFLQMRSLEQGYDKRKIELALDALVTESIAIAEGKLIATT